MPISALEMRDFKPKSRDDLADLLAKKVGLTSKEFDTLDLDSRGRAFRLLGVQQAAIVARIQRVLEKSLESGKSLREAILDIEKLLREGGINSVPNHIVRLTIRQNTQHAYNVAKYRFGRLPGVKAAFPYWQYLTVGNGTPGVNNVRPEHAALHGKIFAKDDPLTAKLWPPLGWNCRCTARDVTEAEAVKAGAVKDASEFLAKKAIDIPPQFDFDTDQLFGVAVLRGLDGRLLAALERRIRDAEARQTRAQQ